MIDRMGEAERSVALAALPRWQAVEGRDAITRTFLFENFRDAFAFMTKVALLAEKMNHHPEWTNIYRTVTVTLATHEANGLTERDIKMAEAMDRFAGD